MKALLILAMILPLRATVFTVKSSGGSFTTISSCAGTAAAGDTCDVFAGSYAGWTEASSGTSGNPITFTVHTGEAVTVTSGITLSSRSWITINGFAFSMSGTCVTGNGTTAHNIVSNNTGTCGSLFRISDGLGTGGSFNTINNNTVTATSAGNNVGVYMYGNSNLVDSNNLQGFDGDCMDLGGQNVVVRNNVCHDLDGTTSGQHIDFIQVVGGGNPTLSFSLIENNTEKNCLNDGGNCHFIIIRTSGVGTADTVILRYNFAYNLDAVGPIDFGGVGDNVPHGHFYNNTLAAVALGSGNGACASWQNASNGAAFNNICYNTMTGASFSPWFDFSGGGLTENGNLVFTTGYSGGWASPYSGEATFAALHNQNPNFANYPTDSTLTAGSPAIASGSKLTTANGSGSSSTALVATDAAFFSDGLGLTSLGVQADWIRVGSSTTVQISSINYSTNAITLASPITWTTGDPIYLYKNSNGNVVLNKALPDVGASPFSPAVVTGGASTPSGGGVTSNGLTR